MSVFRRTFPVRMTVEMHEFVKRMGGAKWLRKLIAAEMHRKDRRRFF